MQLLSLLKKRKAQSEAAATQAKEANRQDLEEKQMQEIKVIDEYAADVKVMSEDQVRLALQHFLDDVKKDKIKLDLNAGTAMRALFNPGGEFYGKPVDRALVMKHLNNMLDTK